MTVLMLVAMVAVCLLVDYFIQLRQTHKQVERVMAPAKDYFLPDGVFSMAGHLWGMVLPTGTLRMGVDRFVTNMVGHIDAIELPQKNTEIKKGDRLLSIKQGDHVLEIPAPFDGRIEETNALVEEQPHRLDRDFKSSWAVTFAPVNLHKAVTQMKVGESAKSWIKKELTLFRDFWTAEHPEAVPVMQDGGLPTAGLLENGSQDLWIKFQSQFLAN